MQATCLITTLDASYGWIEVGGGDWIYNPTGPNVRLLPTLGGHFERNVSSCVDHDRRNVTDTLLFNSSSAENVTDEGARDALKGMTWPADGTDSRGTTSFISRFPPENEHIAGSEWASGYHLGNGIVGTAGHCLAPRLLRNEVHTLKVVFGWSGDVKGKRFAASQVFDIDKWVHLLYIQVFLRRPLIYTTSQGAALRCTRRVPRCHRLRGHRQVGTQMGQCSAQA